LTSVLKSLIKMLAYVQVESKLCDISTIRNTCMPFNALMFGGAFFTRYVIGLIATVPNTLTGHQIRLYITLLSRPFITLV